MKKLLTLALPLALLLGACAERPIETIDLMCGDVHVSAKVFRDRIEAVMYEEDIEFKITQSASGARYFGTYRNAELVLWSKGDEWMLITVAGDDEEIMVSCRR
ncbi:MAG: MliC family protein [Alphaproteobacteria bacterium]|nr:MliC family protein [Alphaproteobacteria bacterium]